MKINLATRFTYFACYITGCAIIASEKCNSMASGRRLFLLTFKHIFCDICNWKITLLTYKTISNLLGSMYIIP